MCIKRDVCISLSLAAFVTLTSLSTVYHRNDPKVVPSPILAIEPGLGALRDRLLPSFPCTS
jgi:hypothetical protein